MLRTWTNPWERRLAERAERYLHDVFGAPAAVTPVKLENLPYFISDKYALWRSDIFGRECVLMAARGSDVTVDEAVRHVDIVKSRATTPLIILVFETLSAARRKALLGRRVAFMVPAVQLFVPEALMDLRERVPRATIGEVEQFSPTAQLVILGSLLQHEPEATSATVLAHRYGVANMSMSRALDELQAAGLADTQRTGKTRAVKFHTRGRELWEQAAARLRSPVRKVRTVGIPFPQHFPARVAGESALSLYTDLSSPRTQRLAVASANWNQLVRDHGLLSREVGDPHGDEVETWSYDPAALATDTVVDRLSLHLSTRDHPDERVAQAAEQLLDNVPWS